MEIADQKLSGGFALMSAFDDSEICRSILENLPTGVCIIDMQKKIILWSDGAERITGRARYEVIGHSCIGERNSRNLALHSGCIIPGSPF